MLKIKSYELKIRESKENIKMTIAPVYHMIYDKIEEVENLFFLENIYFISGINKKVISLIENHHIRFSEKIKSEFKMEYKLMIKETNVSASCYEAYCFKINEVELKYFNEDKAKEEYNKLIEEIKKHKQISNKI